jgi:hypothetical protein
VGEEAEVAAFCVTSVRSFWVYAATMESFFDAAAAGELSALVFALPAGMGTWVLARRGRVVSARQNSMEIILCGCMCTYIFLFFGAKVRKILRTTINYPRFSPFFLLKMKKVSF